MKQGLKERIATAKSVDEVDKLMAEGKGYLRATLNTRNKWRKAAAKRIAELVKS